MGKRREAIGNEDDMTDDAITMGGDGNDNSQQASSYSSTFLQQLFAQRTAFIQVKKEQEQQTSMDHASDMTTNNYDQRSRRPPLRGLHGQRAQLHVRVVQPPPPGSVCGVRSGHHQGGA